MQFNMHYKIEYFKCNQSYQSIVQSINRKNDYSSKTLILKRKFFFVRTLMEAGWTLGARWVDAQLTVEEAGKIGIKTKNDVLKINL